MKTTINKITMKKIYLILVVFVSIITACKNEPGTSEGKDEVKNETAIPEADHHEEARHSETVKLNNQKWVANAETNDGIKKMNSHLDKANGAQNCDSLKSTLEKEFNTILQKCTMTGEGHTQLHNYLVPLSKLMKDLESKKECAEETDKIKDYLSDYYKYFQ
jgi:hypothetical protein